jgi:hypothetical protein
VTPEGGFTNIFGGVGTSYALQSPPAPVADVESLEYDGESIGVIPYFAAAGAALVGGLVWAVVAITTNYDFGIVAWLVGVATGWIFFWVAVGRAGTAGRVLVGLFGAAGIFVGRYMVFVHAVKVAITKEFPGEGVSTGYLDPRLMSFFVHHLTKIVPGQYVIWVSLAFFTAYRIAGGQSIIRRGRGGFGR